MYNNDINYYDVIFCPCCKVIIKGCSYNGHITSKTHYLNKNHKDRFRIKIKRINKKIVFN